VCPERQAIGHGKDRGARSPRPGPLRMESRVDKVAVVDYGSQFTQLIARRIREAHVYSEIFPPGVPLDRLRQYQAIVLSGGPSSVYDDGAPLPPPELLELRLPVLGICYGMQAMALGLGGTVEAVPHREDGRGPVRLGGAQP